MSAVGVGSCGIGGRHSGCCRRGIATAIPGSWNTNGVVTVESIEFAGVGRFRVF